MNQVRDEASEGGPDGGDAGHRSAPIQTRATRATNSDAGDVGHSPDTVLAALVQEVGMVQGILKEPSTERGKRSEEMQLQR